MTRRRPRKRSLGSRASGAACLVEVEGVKQAEVPFETHKIIIRGDGSYVVVQSVRHSRRVHGGSDQVAKALRRDDH